MPRATAATLLSLSLALPAGAAARQGSAELELELGGGFDSNPRRAVDPGSDGDGFLQLLSRLRGESRGDRWRLSGALTEGLRLFAETSSARALASRLEASGSLALGGGLSAGLAAAGSDLTERGGRLDQRMLRGEGSVAWAGQAWGASLSGGWGYFAPRERTLSAFASEGPEGWLRAWATPAEGQRIGAAAGLAAAAYPRWPVARHDTALTLSGEYGYRGPLLAGLGYAWSRNDSSAGGGSYRRHRLTVRAAVPLGEGTALLVRGAVQWTKVGQPLLLPEVELQAGREALDLVDLRITVPLGSRLELALGAAAQRSEGGAGAPTFSRLLLTVGLAGRARWERAGAPTVDSSAGSHRAPQ